ncbi:MAG: hypothetical protein HY704_13050, partial [Gemmatimonadetes bacterium]|nr:hypothetical protein [Gemmatimonadota bacterium]
MAARRRKEDRALAVVPAALEGAVREGFAAAGLPVEVVGSSEGVVRAGSGGWSVVLLSLSVEGVDL